MIIITNLCFDSFPKSQSIDELNDSASHRSYKSQKSYSSKIKAISNNGLKEPFGLICAGGRRLGHSYNDISTINFQNYVPLPKNRHDIAYARSVSDLNLLKSLTNINSSLKSDLKLLRSKTRDFVRGKKGKNKRINKKIRQSMPDVSIKKDTSERPKFKRENSNGRNLIICN